MPAKSARECLDGNDASMVRLGIHRCGLGGVDPHACLEAGLWLVKKPSCPFLLLLARQRSSKRQATGLELPLLGSDLEPEHFLNVTLSCLSRRL
ncbi:predicted protein [Chaetomium globosum CBS 148.51]|uniref:Uncharacterized protein n=1 Tax=Chaetomium globosum (strain ATCC 6205 / CBS 148.51 / DSM 1962 / NBRC 6347 / NRRL 1970) TaxID=306901 RepID=Q2HD22_CHAGB|nr:uncharacterized protein CHGG_01882 [Chaetomium globosum CBS 148.51]EAQ93647.1 predicted protein [Chaetomium globosum CBS 148.51]